MLRCPELAAAAGSLLLGVVAALLRNGDVDLVALVVGGIAVGIVLTRVCDAKDPRVRVPSDASGSQSAAPPPTGSPAPTAPSAPD
jgi:hypothetical protein